MNSINRKVIIEKIEEKVGIVIKDTYYKVIASSSNLVKCNDIVLIEKYAGEKFVFRDTTLMCVNENEILMVL